MTQTGITSLNPKVKNIDPKKGKYAVNYTFRWAGLTPDPTVVVPGFVESSGGSILGTGVSDLIAPLLKANAAANIPPIEWVVGTVVLLPQNVPASTSIVRAAGGLYLVSPDTGQVIALEQLLNSFQDQSGVFVTGDINPGSITFSLPFNTISENSLVQIIKLQDSSTGGNQMNGFANLSFLTYESQVYLRGL